MALEEAMVLDGIIVAGVIVLVAVEDACVPTTLGRIVPEPGCKAPIVPPLDGSIVTSVAPPGVAVIGRRVLWGIVVVACASVARVWVIVIPCGRGMNLVGETVE